MPKFVRTLRENAKKKDQPQGGKTGLAWIKARQESEK